MGKHAGNIRHRAVLVFALRKDSQTERQKVMVKAYMYEFRKRLQSKKCRPGIGKERALRK